MLRAFVLASVLLACSTDGTRPTPTTTTVATNTVGSVGSAEVIDVLDGDTFVVRLPDGRDERVRLIGVNAPESGECLAEEARVTLAGLVDGAHLTLIVDRSDRDDFDRLLRYVEVDTQDDGTVDVGEALVRAGLAIARRYPPDTARASRYDVAQTDAEAAGVGLWAPDACGAPDGAVGDLVFGAVRFDPDGPDLDVLTDEWVRIDNDGSDDVDLTGWSVRDESSTNRYRFPDGFVLATGGSVTLRTGCGTDDADDLYWCRSGSAVWNNDGDTAFLLDPAGNVVATRSG